MSTIKRNTIRAKRRIIYIAGFLFSVPLALTSYVNSSFLETFINEKYVGLLYAASSLVTIVTLLYIEDALTRLGNRKIAILAGFVFFLSLITLAFGKSSLLIIPGFIAYFVSYNVMVSALDIFIEDFSSKKSIGTSRGKYLMILNLAWVVSQTISGSIIEKSSYKGIYLFASLFMLLVTFIFAFFLRDFKDPKYKRISVLQTIGFFIRNESIKRIYIINFILKFFYAWMVIYTPIYLHEVIGFDWGQIGIIFSFMLLPFVFIPYPLGHLSDKIGEKKMLTLGFILIATATAFIPSIQSSALWLWAIVLFTTRVGAATIEIMSESYFFKKVHEDNADVIGFFRNTVSASYLIAPALAVPILLYIPTFDYMFFILSGILLTGLFLSLRLKDIK